MAEHPITVVNLKEFVCMSTQKHGNELRVCASWSQCKLLENRSESNAGPADVPAMSERSRGRQDHGHLHWRYSAHRLPESACQGVSCHHCYHTRAKQRQLETSIYCQTAQEFLQCSESYDRPVGLVTRIALHEICDNGLSLVMLNNETSLSICPQSQGEQDDQALACACQAYAPDCLYAC